VDTIGGHDYQHGMTIAHNWYGTNTKPANPGDPGNSCPHGQIATSSLATGPGAGSLAGQAWIYNPDDLIAVALGNANTYDPNPASTFRISSIPNCTISEESAMCYKFNGCYFDAATNKLFLAESQADHEGCCAFMPRVHVFQVTG
jgi:hypothetical protein